MKYVKIITIAAIVIMTACSGELTTGGTGGTGGASGIDAATPTSAVEAFSFVADTFRAECAACHGDDYMGNAGTDNVALRQNVLDAISQTSISNPTLPLVIPGDADSSHLINVGIGAHFGSKDMSPTLLDGLTAWINLEEGAPQGVPPIDPSTTLSTASIALEWFADCMDEDEFDDVYNLDSIANDRTNQNDQCNQCHGAAGGQNNFAALENDEDMFGQWTRKKYLIKYIAGVPNPNGPGYTVAMSNYIVANGQSPYNNHDPYTLPQGRRNGLTGFFTATKNRMEAAAAAGVPCTPDADALPFE